MVAINSITSVLQFCNECAKLPAHPAAVDDVYALFEVGCTNEVQEKMYVTFGFDTQNCVEPTRATLNALGDFMGIELLATY